MGEPASLRLRAGDVDAVAVYDARGRILDGIREEMAAVVVRRWLADYLTGWAGGWRTGTCCGWSGGRR